MKIIRDIIAGNHAPQHLATYRDWRCGKSEAEIAKSLEGDYRPEHLFALRQAVELYDVYTEKIKTCDGEIERQFAHFSCQVDLAENPIPPARRPSSTRPKNHPDFDLRSELYQMAGVDLTQVDGLDVLTVQTILSEIGTNMSKWPTVKRFTSWLGVSPQNDKTGGKVVRSKTKKTDNRANLAFRQAAASLKNSKSALGNYYRRMKTKLGSSKAIVATAHKVIMDWFSRFVLSWRLSNTQDAFFCQLALEQALESGCPQIFNTDQGAQFTAHDFNVILLAAGIRISMDGRGHFWDNIF